MSSLKKYNLCIDARLLNKSGIGRYLSELLPHLNRQYSLICIIDKECIEYAIRNKIDYIVSKTKIYSIKEQFELVKLIPECEVFWSPHFNVPILPIKAKKRLVTIHDSYHLVFNKQLSFFERIYAKIFYNSALVLSNEVITVSEFSKFELLRMMSNRHADKVNVIHNGVTNFRSSIDRIYQGNPYFLFVGNVKPHKNLKNAILAFKRFCETNKDLKFDFKIVGQKGGFINADDEVDALILNDLELNKKIKFTGFIGDNELKVVYENAFCLVFPSLYEGFGLPPLEAMTANTPSIVSNKASMPELCGDAVLYFNPESVSSISECMYAIASNKHLYDQLVLSGIEQVKKYNWKICAKLHIELIGKMLII